jgi:hypothetical protein
MRNMPEFVKEGLELRCGAQKVTHERMRALGQKCDDPPCCLVRKEETRASIHGCIKTRGDARVHISTGGVLRFSRVVQQNAHLLMREERLCPWAGC